MKTTLLLLTLAVTLSACDGSNLPMEGSAIAAPIVEPSPVDPAAAVALPACAIRLTAGRSAVETTTFCFEIEAGSDLDFISDPGHRIFPIVNVWVGPHARICYGQVEDGQGGIAGDPDLCAGNSSSATILAPVPAPEDIVFVSTLF